MLTKVKRIMFQLKTFQKGEGFKELTWFLYKSDKVI